MVYVLSFQIKYAFIGLPVKKKTYIICLQRSYALFFLIHLRVISLNACHFIINVYFCSFCKNIWIVKWKIYSPNQTCFIYFLNILDAMRLRSHIFCFFIDIFVKWHTITSNDCSLCAKKKPNWYKWLFVSIYRVQAYQVPIVNPRWPPKIQNGRQEI